MEKFALFLLWVSRFCEVMAAIALALGAFHFTFMNICNSAIFGVGLLLIVVLIRFILNAIAKHM